MMLRGMSRSTTWACGEESVMTSGTGTRQRGLVRCSDSLELLLRCTDQGMVTPPLPYGWITSTAMERKTALMNADLTGGAKTIVSVLRRQESNANPTPQAPPPPRPQLRCPGGGWGWHL